jgi:hypothetical protein
MTTPQTSRKVKNVPVPSSIADEIVSVLEYQLAGFRTIHDITIRMKELFSESDSVTLAKGLQERAASLERIQESEKRLKELKLQWRASSGLPPTTQDARIGTLVDECQAVIGEIVELDRSLHQTALARQTVIEAELTESHQRRRPLTAYLGNPLPTATYSIPVSGRNVHFPEV